jgi:hypothetical protein
MASADPDNPIIACTVKELGFAAWQESRGASSREKSGPSWELFSTWFDSCIDFGNEQASSFAYSIKEIARLAWNEAQATRRDAWWKTVVESQPSIVSG